MFCFTLYKNLSSFNLSCTFYLNDNSNTCWKWIGRSISVSFPVNAMSQTEYRAAPSGINEFNRSYICILLISCTSRNRRTLQKKKRIRVCMSFVHCFYIRGPTDIFTRAVWFSDDSTQCLPWNRTCAFPTLSSQLSNCDLCVNCSVAFDQAKNVQN